MNTPAAASTRTPSEVAREMFHAIFSERDLSDPSRYWTDESVDHFLALRSLSSSVRRFVVVFSEQPPS
jgi:hypothetical protein